jgi:SAM-dependent methyltransferase
MTAETHCPLCQCAEVADYFRDRRRPYLRCGQCSLVFVPREFLLDRVAEKAEYDLHRNAVDDPRYRSFLSRLAHPLTQRLAPGARGLDFGCGPGPALAHMLREAGFDVAVYDSFYAPDESVLEQRYDFICATEVVEHLHQPGNELARLWRIVRPGGGYLGVMTKLVHDREAFASWHYKNDPTHVCFFSRATWQWWAQQQAAELRFIGSDVILLRRP